MNEKGGYKKGAQREAFTEQGMVCNGNRRAGTSVHGAGPRQAVDVRRIILE
jgi:hypothetical protein